MIRSSIHHDRRSDLSLAEPPAAGTGFTLVELLVVISIIALLLGLLLPSLNKAMATAKSTQCQSQMRQIMTANTMYSGEYDGFLPFCNSNGMENPGASNYDPTHAWTGAGWLYDFSKDNAHNKIEDIEDGALWPYLHERKIYRCPADKGPWHDTQNLTSFTMNSVVRGFEAKVAPSVQLAKFASTALLIWEGDESNKSGGTWNDGNNDPWDELISSRHNNAGTAGFADTHVESVGFQQFFDWKSASQGPNPLYCNPLTSNGMSPIVVTP